MQYYDLTWERVLNDVAKKSGKQLVVKDLPHGRVTRNDRRKYSLAESVRILNSELEPKGYRLLQQGDYLVVLNLKSARARYTRPELPDAQQHGRRAGSDGQSESLQAADQRAQQRQRRFETLRGSGPIRQAGAQQYNDERSPVRNISARVPDFEAESRIFDAQPPARPVEQSVSIKNRTAQDVARRIYNVFRDRSELVEAEKGNLPAFDVYEDETAEARKQFTVKIDPERNKLHVVSDRRTIPQLVQMVRRLDTVEKPDNAVGLVDVPQSNTRFASQLQRQMNRLVSNQRVIVAQNDQPQAAAGVPQPEGDASLNAGGLRSNVTVEAIPGIGIIVRGNEADVERVEDLIKRIETLSEGNVPEIEVRTLKYVNSEAMAELLGSVYERLTQLRTGSTTANQPQTVGFIPLVEPNALVILASANEKASIVELLDQLDQAVDPLSEFEVFRLKYAIASQIVTAIENFYDEPTGLATRVQVIADVRANAVVVQARPRDMSEVAALIEKLDKDDSGATNRVNVIKLKNAVAEELSEVINAAIQAVTNPPVGTQGGFVTGGNSGQNAQVLRETKSVVLEFLKSDESGESLIRSGILADVRISADVRSNSLIVTAPEASMNLLEEIIRALDQPTDTVAEIKVFQLENSDATLAVDLLSTLFEDTNQEDSIGIQLADAEDASSTLIPLRFSSDVRTNTVLAIGGAGALRVVEAILLRLDESEMRQRETVVVELKNVRADDAATALDAFVQAQIDLLERSPDLISDVQIQEQDVVIAPEINSNNLLISASPRYMDQFLKIVRDIDADPPQVVIQALLVEVELDNTDEFGMEVGFQDSILFNRSLGGVPGFLFNSTNALGNNTTVTGSDDIGAQGISSFSLGRQNPNLGYGGFVFSASSENVSVLLRALAARRQVHVLSRPIIRTVDNQIGRMEVVSEVGVLTGININQTSSSPIIERQPAGVILEVTPRITPDDVIVMNILAENSQFRGSVPVFTDTQTGTVFESPVKDRSTATAQVAVPNGQTIVLGGMISRTDDTIERKVPILGDIPILGVPFRYDSTTKTRTEVLIFLTPRVIRTDADSEVIKQIETERMHFDLESAEDLHGPLFSLPPRQGEGGPVMYDGAAPEADYEFRAPPVEDSYRDVAPPENPDFSNPQSNAKRSRALRQVSGRQPKTKSRVQNARFDK